MALSTAAQKLLAYLGIYKITATEYNRRINGNFDNDYNFNWFIGDFATSRGQRGAQASPQIGVFKTALAELVAAYY